MRPWLLIFLLLLSTIIHVAQGIRSGKGSPPDSIREFPPGKRNINDGVEEVILCKSKHCSGRIRKLTVTPISSTTTVSENGKNEENVPINSSSQSQQLGQPPPDILDVAGMDYSLARRKPPVHN